MKFRLVLVVLVAFFALESTAAAFCGFYVSGGDSKLFNEATQAVLMRHDDQTVLTMQNSYEGPLEDFAMVVPVPQVLKKDDVRTLNKTIFDKIDRLSAPRLVEYWEQNPCPQAGVYGSTGRIGDLSGLRSSIGLGNRGSGFGGGGYVNVKAEFAVGEYEIVVLDTNDASALDSWLKEHNYKIPQGAAPYFRPYIESGMYFFVARVNAKKVKFEDERAVLSPLRFHYQSKEFSLPVRLGMINSRGKQDLIVYVLGQKQRYELANYPNVTIPTNIEVAPDVRHDFGSFYEALFNRTVEENPKAVVTEYSWTATKCDPCPGGAIWSATLNAQEFASLGADVLRLTGWNQTQNWVLTRLHARYSPDDAGQDLVFQKADSVVGGREVRTADGSIEKGTTPAANNQFQGRYIVRHEWEGKAECEKPQRGIWGPPPNPAGMKITRDTVVLELRRQAALKADAPLDDISIDGPYSDDEREAIRFHLVSKYGTSYAPASSESVAPSANTRGVGVASLSKSQTSLASMIREPIPPLNLEPSSEPDKSTNLTVSEETEEVREVREKTGDAPTEKEPAASGCSAVAAETSPLLLVVLGLLGFMRRRL